MQKKINLILLLFLLPFTLFAQHRGDNLAFQGFPVNNNVGVKAIALGGAYTSQTGDVSSLFYNPAGLANINNLQVSIGANRSANSWRENQAFRPNRMFWTLAFYLEGLYTPDPANNGIWDYELAQDSSYIVREPVLGLDPFGEEAADWKKKSNDFGLNNIAAAYPITVADHKIVVSATYSRNVVKNFDRNDTYLDPHIGYDEYSVVERVVTDTVRFSWSRFTRQRDGHVQNFTAGLAYDLNKKIKIGFSMNMMNGKTTDFQSLNRVGYFDIAKDNRFRFSYDTLDVSLDGESKYKAVNFNFGLVLKLERLSIGLNIQSPYGITREWNYSNVTVDSLGLHTSNSNGTDTFEYPASFSFGTSLSPVDQFTFLLDYQMTRFSQGKIDHQPEDATIRKIPDQTELRCGIEYRMLDYLSLLAGYRYRTETFVPDGAAIKDRGPAVTGYTLGASFVLWDFGRIDIAYNFQRLKYYDSYFSNTNYVYESMNDVLVGYTIGF